MISSIDRILFLDAYLICVEWADKYLFDYYCSDKFASDAKEDCEDFINSNIELLEEYKIKNDISQAGHDFWLTRQGHGAGFWDRGLGKLGDNLTTAAKCYSSY